MLALISKGLRQRAQRFPKTRYVRTGTVGPPGSGGSDGAPGEDAVCSAPADPRRHAAVALDHHHGATRQGQVLAGGEKVVAGITADRDPGAAGFHPELAAGAGPAGAGGAACQGEGFASGHGVRAGRCGRSAAAGGHGEGRLQGVREAHGGPGVVGGGGVGVAVHGGDARGRLCAATVPAQSRCDRYRWCAGAAVPVAQAAICMGPLAGGAYRMAT